MSDQPPAVHALFRPSVFGVTPAGWRPDLPDACHEPVTALLWLEILEPLGRVPEGSTARFLLDGNLPG